MGVPTVPYEYLFRPPSSDRLQPPAQTGGLRGYCWGNLPQVPWAASYGPKNLRYDRHPSAANGWGTTHPIPGNGSTTQV
jgi:hypothetical protein